MTDSEFDPPQLAPGYGGARTTTVVTASLILASVWLKLPLPDPIPVLRLSLPERPVALLILIVVLGYSTLRLVIEWMQSDWRRRKTTASRLDFSLGIVLALGAVVSWFLTTSSASLPRDLPLFSAAILTALGVGSGVTLGMAFWSAQFIRSRDHSSKIGLPRIPVATRSIFYASVFFGIGILLVFALSPSFAKPMSALWPWLLFAPMVLISGGSMVDLLLPKRRLRDGSVISRADYIKAVQKAFDFHDARYIVGGWYPRRAAEQSSLFHASGSGNIEMLRKLLARGGNPDEIGVVGWTPLMIAVAQQQHDAAKILLQEGANPNVVNTMGRTPLMFAAKYGNLALVEMLLDAGADPNLRGFASEPSALAVAGEIGSLEIVRILLKVGADPMLADFDGVLPLQLAERAGHGEVAAVLRRAMRGQEQA